MAWGDFHDGTSEETKIRNWKYYMIYIEKKVTNQKIKNRIN